MQNFAKNGSFMGLPAMLQMLHFVTLPVTLKSVPVPAMLHLLHLCAHTGKSHQKKYNF